jgi:glycosyltransferase involved in cell wall biosynthesis
MADAIVVQTPEQVGLCRGRFGREPIMIRSLVEEPEEDEAEPEAFLWAAKAAWYKNPLAYVALARAVPEARFRMVPVPSEKDSPELMRELESAAAGLENLDVLPPRPRAELLRLTQRAVAVVNTSDFEGMPNTLLEGWVRGVPALSLAHDPDGVIEREALGGFAHGSQERLAQLARELWTERSRRALLAERCRAYVRREHGVDAIAGQWIEALAIGSDVLRPPRQAAASAVRA